MINLKVAEYLNRMNLAECPPETQDIKINLANRQKAIDDANYGPLNPNEPTDDYWKRKAEQFHSGDLEAAKSARCGNCGFFDIKKKTLDCIAKGIGGEDAWDTIEAGNIGLCLAFDFKCAAARTCDAWLYGGPVTDEQPFSVEKLDIEPNPCWKGYEPYGLKPDGSPNCIPVK